MKRLAMAATLMVALSVPAWAGEVPTMGVVAQPQPPAPNIATTVLLTIIRLVGR